MKTLHDDIVKAAQHSFKQYKILPSVQLGQGVLESAWFTKATGKYNFFGIKAVKDQPFTISWTHEVIDDKLTPVQQRFANYSSPQDAFDAHAELLSNPEGPYKKALPYLNDMEKYVCAIAPIYATDRSYSVNLIRLIKVEGFLKYDIVDNA